jgi:hypothetical protein
MQGKLELRRLFFAMLSVSLLAVLPSRPAVADPERLTPATREATRARLAGTAAAAPATWNQIMGAGDISADPATRTTADLATSEILLQARPTTVFTAGDNQYPRGQIQDFTDPDGYAGSWGRTWLKRRTCPTVGNHEYADPLPGPAGYLAYFRPPCPHRPDIDYARTREGYLIRTVYAYRPAPGSGWWAYVLDSQCRHAEGPGPSCARSSNQLNWFRRHVAAHPAKCRIVFYHHPRFGNGAPLGRRLSGVLALCRGRLCRAGKPDHHRAQSRLRTLHFHDARRGHRPLLHRTTVLHRGYRRGAAAPVLQVTSDRHPLPGRQPSRRAPDHPGQGPLGHRVRSP